MHRLKSGKQTPNTKTCFDRQVVGTVPKQGQKVNPGSIVYLKYVTGEIIEKSKQLHNAAEMKKAEAKKSKSKRAKNKEKTREGLF